MEEEKQQQWLSIAAVVLVILGLGFFLFRQNQQDSEVEVTPEEVAASAADEVLERMNVQLPEEADRANLSDSSGGGSAGVATKVEEGELVSVSVLASLPELSAGEFFEAYLVDDEDGSSLLYLGKLRAAKGGYMVDYSGELDVDGLSKVMVTREKVDDRQPETTVLEGDFK